jgi:hypothetical protein
MIYLRMTLLFTHVQCVDLIWPPYYTKLKISFSDMRDDQETDTHMQHGRFSQQ